MKVKLLKRLRREVRDEVTIYSITTSGGTTTGMRYGHNGNYGGLFSMGDTEEDVMRKASHIYFENNRDRLIKKYRKQQ